MHLGRPPCDDALILHGAPAVPCAQESRRWVLVAAIVGSSMAFIDGTVVNVALPAIQRDLNATAFDAQWVVESYALFLAALLLVGGSLGDHYGRRRIFAIGVAVFALASIGCALSRDVQQLIVARAVQGIGAALLVPGSLALISATFPQNERGRAIGTWSGFTGITAALGPVIGGFLIDHYSWTWAFLLNVPLALVVLAIVAWRLPESRGASARQPLDLWGTVLVTLALGGIVYAFIEAPLRGWRSSAVLVALVGGFVAAVLFVVVQKRSRGTDAAARVLSRSQLHRRKPADAAALCGAGRQSLFFSAQPDPGAGLRRNRGRRRAAAVHRDHVRGLALGRHAGRPLRGQECRW